MFEAIVVTATVLLFVVVGIIRSRSPSHRSLETYTVGKRDRNWFQIAAGLSMTYVGGAATVNMASLGYTYGFGALYDPIAVFLGLLIVLFLMASYRSGNALTLTGTLGSDDRPLRIFLGLVATFIYLLLTAAQFVALGKLVSPFFNISNLVITLVASALVFSYVWLGGFRSVNLTDVVQYLFIIGFFFLPLLYLLTVGGIPVRMDPTVALEQESVSVNLAVLLSLSLLFVPLSQDVKIRVLAAKSDRAARIGVLIGGASYFVFVLVSIMAGRALSGSGSELSDPELALATVFANFAAPIQMFATLAVLAAIISTMDSWSFGAVVTIAHDVLPSRNANPAKGALRIANIVVFCSAILIALFFNQVLGLILTGLLIYVSVLGPIAVGRWLGVRDRQLLVSGIVTLTGIAIVELTGIAISPKAVIYPISHMILVFVLRLARRLNVT